MTLSRKTKPLGPRQRAAYVKPFAAAVAEAEAKVATEQAACAATQAAFATGLRRLGAPAIVVRANPPLSPTLTSTVELKAWGLHLSAKSTPAEKRKARKALLAGEVSIECNGGSPKLPSLLRRFRAMAKADVARLRILDRRIALLHEQRNALIGTGFERSVPYTPEKLADIVIGLATLPRNGFYIDEYAVTRARNALADAQKHDDTKTCPCGRCTGDRARAASEKEWADRRAAQAKAQAKAELATA